MNVVLEFSGGAELLVGKVRQHKITLPDNNQKWTIGKLLAWIKDNLLKERSELFLKDPSAKELDVRPGILVLVNEADWELCGQTSYELEVCTITNSKTFLPFLKIILSSSLFAFRKEILLPSFQLYTEVNFINSLHIISKANFIRHIIFTLYPLFYLIKNGTCEQNLRHSK